VGVGRSHARPGRGRGAVVEREVPGGAVEPVLDDDRPSAFPPGREEAPAVGGQEGRGVLVVPGVGPVPRHRPVLEVVDAAPAQVGGVVRDQQGGAVGRPVDDHRLGAVLADVDPLGVAPVGGRDVDVGVLQVLGLVGGVGDPVAVGPELREPDRPLVVGDLLGLVGRQVVAVEVQLAALGRGVQQVPAVGADARQATLGVVYHELLDLAVEVDRTDVVLLVAALVAVKEDPLAVGVPGDRVGGVPGNLAVAHPDSLAGRDRPDVQLVSSGAVVVVGDPVAVGASDRRVDRWKACDLLERELDVLRGHTRANDRGRLKWFETRTGSWIRVRVPGPGVGRVVVRLPTPGVGVGRVGVRVAGLGSAVGRVVVGLPVLAPAREDPPAFRVDAPTGGRQELLPQPRPRRRSIGSLVAIGHRRTPRLRHGEVIQRRPEAVPAGSKLPPRPVRARRGTVPGPCPARTTILPPAGPPGFRSLRRTPDSVDIT